MDMDSKAERLASYLAVERSGRAVVLRLTEEFLYLALDLEGKRALARLFEEFSTSPEVGAVVLLGTATCFGAEQADRFWRHVLDHDEAASSLATPHAAQGETDLHREQSGLHQFGARVRGCNKAVVVALQGEVVFPLLGISLLCDYRLVAEGTVFRNRNHQFGMPPGGALCYLLPAYLGFGRASELLLEGRGIAADEALSLGLVHRVVPAEELEAEALAAAERFAAIPWQSVSATKSLLSHTLGALPAHFELETDLIRACLLHLKREKGKP